MIYVNEKKIPKKDIYDVNIPAKLEKTPAKELVYQIHAYMESTMLN